MPTTAFFAGEFAKKFNNRIAARKVAVAFALFSIDVSKSAYTFIHSYTLINDAKKPGTRMGYYGDAYSPFV